MAKHSTTGDREEILKDIYLVTNTTLSEPDMKFSKVKGKRKKLDYQFSAAVIKKYVLPLSSPHPQFLSLIATAIDAVFQLLPSWFPLDVLGSCS